MQAANLFALVSVAGAGQSVKDLQSVSNQVNRTQGVLGGLGKNAGQIGKGFGQVGAGILRIGETLGLAAVGAVAASAKVGASFQSMTELIHTQAGASQAEVEKMRTGIMALVHEVGTTPQELAKGIYHIESVGLRGAQALDVLRASALGAKVGLADMESVTNALTAVTYSNIKGTKGASDAMAILDGIVGVGNMHLQDLTDSFKSGILGTSAAFGITLQSLGAAIATLTDAGVPANIAATRLNMTISHMGAPVPKAIDTLKKLGISQFQLANDMRKPDGINAALQDIGKHMQAVGEMSAAGVLTPQGTADLSKIFGGSRFGATAMQLLTNAMAPTASGLGRIADKYKLIEERSKTFNDNVAATKQTAGYVWGLLVADIQNAGLAFSQGFLPSLARAGAKLDAFVFGHLGDFKKLGIELGGWLDKIDWASVQSGANGFVGVLQQIVDVISKVPPQIDLAIVGFLALNKLSGGLVGKGLENIVGGLAGGVATIGKNVLRSLLVKVPGIGGAIGAITALHVWVDNMPLGGFGGGLPPVAPVAAAGGGLLSTIIGAIGASAAVGGASAIGNEGGLFNPLKMLDDSALRDAYSVRGKELIAQGMSTADAFKQVQKELTDGSLAIRAAAMTAAAALASNGSLLDRGGRESGITGNITTGGFDKRLARDMNVTVGGFDARLTDAAKKVAGALGSAAATIVAGRNLNLASMIKGIEARSQAKYHWKSGKPPESWVQGTFGRDILRTEKNILRSHATAATKLAGVEALQRITVQNKDWGVARKLKKDIADLQEQVRKQKLSVEVHPQTVNLKVDGQVLVSAIVHSNQWNRAF